MFKEKFHRDVFKALLVISAVIVLCRVTVGVMAVLVALFGAGCAMQRKSGYLAVCYLIFPILMIFNRAIIGLSPVLLMTARVGNMFMIAVMMLTGAGFRGRMRERLPIMWLFAYCLVACISSIDGWMPLISYLKLAQFVFFLIGLLFVSRILQQSDEGLYQLRCALMAIAIIFVWGSVVARFVPSVGYSMALSLKEYWGEDIVGAEILQQEGVTIFNGMVAHSQILAPTVAMMISWLLCDMLLVEKRPSLLHIGLLMPTPILLYMSRSRGGLLEFVIVIAMVIFVCIPRVRLSRLAKNKLVNVMSIAVVMLIIAGIVTEVQSQSITKWIRKRNDLKSDDRTLTEAFTGSRMALIQQNLVDFRLNPILGKGFQVVKGMDREYRSGRYKWYTASVEKGVTPYVILGETGLIGAGVFVVFMFSFYATCLRRRYLALMTMFTCFLATNLADSNFFSPGGGGFGWILSCVGGFGLDLISIRMAHGVWSGPDGKPSPPPMLG